MRVAWLQGIRQFSGNHTYPQTYSGRGPQSSWTDVGSMYIHEKNEAMRGLELLQTPAQETHILRHDHRRHPRRLTSPNVCALRRTQAVGSDLVFADLFFTQKDHLRQQALEAGLVTDCSHACDVGSALS